MPKKITKNTLPTDHQKEDFKCFGPIVTEDGKFEDTMLADLGCFKQGEVDSNKYYHASVVQSTVNDKWYTYFEYGRTGQSTNPQFQFIECNSKDEAQREYCKQLHSKNDKRGQWTNHSVLGKILQPKPGKDCYLVRPQTSRSTGLPDAKNITDSQPAIAAPNISKNFDAQTAKLLNDLKVGSTEYTRSSVVGNAVPTQDAIAKCRDVLAAATKVNNKQKHNKQELQELIELTNLAFSIIPKKKKQKAKQEDWILSPANISLWQDDLDVYEAAIAGQTISTSSFDLPFNLIYVPVKSNKYKYVSDFIHQASNRRHHISDMKILNIWEIQRDETYKKFAKNVEKMRAGGKSPLFQKKRLDISDEDRYNYKQSGTWQLFHGTRSVNVGGILSTGLRLPKELSNTVITGAMFGPLVYHADDWRKSCGYCSISNSYWARGNGSIKNRGAFMFVNDVVLGNAYFPRYSQNFTSYPQGHDSIYADSNKCNIMNNEFVTFPDQVNLRYLIEFEV